MGLIQRVRQMFKRGPQFGSPLDFFSTYDIDRLAAMMGGVPGKSPFAYSAWVHACMRIRAGALAAMPFQLRRGADGSSTVVTEGPWADLFRRPNPQLTARELWIATSMYLDDSGSGGECFWVLEGKGDKLGDAEVPIEVWPLPGGRQWEPVRSETTKLILGWKYTDPRTGRSLTYPVSQVVHHRNFNPHDPERGISPLQAAMTSVSADDLAARWNRNFFRNNASPEGVLSTPKDALPLQPDQITQMKREWNDLHQGVDKRGRIAILQGGAAYQPVSPTHTEMGFIEQRKWTRDEIAAVYQIPQFLLGLTNELKYATARESRRVLYENNVLPLGDQLADSVNDLIDRRSPREERIRAEVRGGRHLYGCFDKSVVEALRDAYSERIANAERMQRLGVPINDAAEHLELGIEPIEGGDVPLVPFGLTPLKDVIEGPKMGPNPFAPAGDEEDDQEDDDQEEEDEDLDDVEDEGDRARTSRMDAGRRRRLATWMQLVARVYAPGERSFLRVARAHFRRIAAQIAALLGEDRALRTRMSAAELSDFLARNRAEWDKAIAKVAKPVYHQAAAQALKLLEEQVGGFDVVKGVAQPEILEFLAQKEMRLSQVNETFVSAVRESLVEGLGAGETVGQLQKRLEHELGVGDTRAQAIARTEVASASNGARTLAMQAEGVDGVEWVSAGDSDVRPTHVSMDGQKVRPGETFSSPSGAALRFPGDPNAPPAEICNCRCATSPIYAD